MRAWGSGWRVDKGGIFMGVCESMGAVSDGWRLQEFSWVDG